MNIFRSISRCPEPFRTCWFATFGLFSVAFVVLLFIPGSLWIMGPVGLSVASMGACLLFNINGAADAFIGVIKSTPIWGVDYSRSVMATPIFARYLYGGLALIVGSGFVYASVTG